MSFHRNQAQFQRARWRRRILVPIWIFQAALLFAILGIFSYRLAHTVGHFDEDRKAGKTPTVELVWESTNVGLGLLCIVLTGLEVHRLVAETLTPFFLLACNVLKMTGASAILALDIVVYTQRSEGDWSTIGLALDAAALAAMLTLGVYSIVAFRRLARTDDDYNHHPQSNVKAFGFGRSYDSSVELGREGRSLANNGAAMGRALPYNDVPAAYDVRAANLALPTEYPSTRARSHSATSSIMGRISFSGRDRSLSGSHDPAPSSVSRDGIEPRPLSYNHERDTQFDAYRNFVSASLSKDTIDKALGTELWGASASGSASRPLSDGAAAAAVDRSNSLVGTGVVAATASHREVVNRQVSWSVEHGGTPDGAASQGTPTIHEQEEEDYVAHNKARAAAQQEKSALLQSHERDAANHNLDDDERGPIPETIQ
ncbi:hypothetical protein F503_03831 [Ophiostoma piceae UAMH 11346]|uniref:Uncharacterized protein n=1 Tax=Ophiostoma piceae (strain UAMH 11346) TaxID=1262450 RepID=S3C0M6_OPHP1|nr:hypothetical protein F503_03831 [Ophiostoma piceae UAMH 11346]